MGTLSLALDLTVNSQTLYGTIHMQQTSVENYAVYA